MNDCMKYQELISCLIDGELTKEESADLEKHIAHCPECMAMFKDFSAVSGMVRESMAAVPDSLHQKIMDGIKASAGKTKKPLLIRLRPYISAAACLVVVVGVLFTLKGGSKLKMADSAANESAAISKPASAIPAEAPAEAIDDAADSEFSLEDSLDRSTSEEAEVPEADMSADMPAEGAPPEQPAEEPAEEPVNESISYDPLYGYCLYGSIPEDASLILIKPDGSTECRKLADLESLAQAIIPSDYVPATDIAAAAVLELVYEGVSYCMELYFDGETLLFFHDGRYRTASVTVSEFLAIE